MRIALVQASASTDPNGNLEMVRERLADLRRRCGGRYPHLVLFPEATMASFATRSAAVAEPLDGPFAQGVRALADEFRTVVALGMFTPASGERCRNTLLVTGGGLDEHYDKLHLFDAYGFAESDHVEPGDRLVLVEVGGLTLGLALCYDVRFPELFTAYARAGASLVLVAASWQDGVGKADQWRTLIRARALDATLYVAGCGQPEPPPGTEKARSNAPLGVGGSLVVGPDGRVLAEAGTGQETLVVDLDPEAVARARARMPLLENARFVSELRPRP